MDLQDTPLEQPLPEKLHSADMDERDIYIGRKKQGRRNFKIEI